MLGLPQINIHIKELNIHSKEYDIRPDNRIPLLLRSVTEYKMATLHTDEPTGRCQFDRLGSIAKVSVMLLGFTILD